MRKIVYANDAREQLLSGVNIIAKAVKVTLGPSGRNVLIRNSGESRPFSTKDGVTVAGQVESECPIEMAAIESIQDIANNSDSEAGDGTTTATVIGEAILSAGLDFPKDLNLLDIKRGIDETVRIVIELLKENAIDIQENYDMLKQVALISSNYDEECADIVLRAFKVSGRQGIVNIKRSQSYETYLTTIEGMTLQTGYRSKYYVNNFENDTCVLDKPYVFMTNKKIEKIADTNFEALLSQVAEQDASILIICPDIDPVISDMILRNVTKGALKACVAKSPGFGNDQEELLKDLGVVLGRDPFLENERLQFEDLPREELLDKLPRSEEVTIGEQISSIKGAYGLDETEQKKLEQKMKARANYLREQVKKTRTTYEKSQLQTRISRITDGISYINIGARSDTEYIEKQGRIQDALYSIKSANEEGIVPGGGAALLSIADSIVLESKSENESIAYGSKIVIQAIRQPFFQIIENVGIKLTSRQLNQCSSKFNAGFNAKTKEVEKDMIKAGIIDPVKVTRVALESAASISGMLLTTECVIIDPDVYKKTEFQTQ